MQLLDVGIPPPNPVRAGPGQVSAIVGDYLGIHRSFEPRVRDRLKYGTSGESELREGTYGMATPEDWFNPLVSGGKISPLTLSGDR